MPDKTELTVRDAVQAMVGRLEKNAGWRNSNWQCVTDPALLEEAAALLTAQQAEIEARDAEIARLREANQRLRNGYADAVSGYEYILLRHGRLDGVGFQRVQDHFFEWVTMPEREGLLAGSHDLALSARRW